MDHADLRISDADRDGVADLLRHAHAEGRIDQVELTNRLDAVWSAQTYRDLEPVIADLPRPGAPSAWESRSGRAVPVAPVGATVSPAHQPGKARRTAQVAIGASWMVWTGVVGINVVIWAIILITTGETSGFWPLWVAGPWGAALGAVTVAERRTRPRPAPESTESIGARCLSWRILDDWPMVAGLVVSRGWPDLVSGRGTAPAPKPPVCTLYVHVLRLSAAGPSRAAGRGERSADGRR